MACIDSAEFQWNTAAFSYLYLYIICYWFHDTKGELSSCNLYLDGHKAKL